MRAVNDSAVEIAVNDIVQLDPAKTINRMLSGCLMVVTEIKSWGLVGYVQTTGIKGNPGGAAYYRAAHGTYEKTGGKVVWIMP